MRKHNSIYWDKEDIHRHLKIFIVILMTVMITSGFSQEQKKPGDFPILKGPYLGQKPPGMTLEVFAPGIVSTKKNETLFGFFNSGTRFLFSRTDPDFDDWKNEPIYIMEIKKGGWTKPSLSPYIGRPWYLNLTPFLPGKSLYFARWGGDNVVASPENLDIWEVKGTSHGWSEPRKLPTPINSDTIDTYPSVSQDGTLYFFSGRKGGLGRDDVYFSRLVKGKHSTVENPGSAINSIYHEIDPFIAPDDSYLIFCSSRPEGFGEIDLYVSFHKKDGSWTPAVNLGNSINSSAYDWIPFISDDGKYLFFISNRTGNYDIYWIEARVIEKFKTKEL
jgi:hypothetical protein